MQEAVRDEVQFRREIKGVVEMLGYCTLEQLKYFCKHTNCHRTHAKNRLLYSTNMGLIKQLEPRGIP
ncbi:hypothetical protein RJT34_19973 [Clitoria ternatea]|uniref:DUF7086 domain-containing protein n=1 Tax=Clitoria ternatea TaxID=43366 RepID=A0AAN9ISC0_CLITE